MGTLVGISLAIMLLLMATKKQKTDRASQKMKPERVRAISASELLRRQRLMRMKK